MKPSLTKKILARIGKQYHYRAPDSFKPLNKKFGMYFHLGQDVENDDSKMREKLIINFILKTDASEGTSISISEGYPISDPLLDKALEILIYRMKTLCKKELATERQVLYDIYTDYYEAKRFWSVRDQDIPLKEWNPPFPTSKWVVWKKYYDSNPRIGKTSNNFIDRGILFTLKIFYPEDEAWMLLRNMNSNEHI
jgi:hypothetical protein